MGLFCRGLASVALLSVLATACGDGPAYQQVPVPQGTPQTNGNPNGAPANGNPNDPANNQPATGPQKRPFEEGPEVAEDEISERGEPSRRGSERQHKRCRYKYGNEEMEEDEYFDMAMEEYVRDLRRSYRRDDRERARRLTVYINVGSRDGALNYPHFRSDFSAFWVWYRHSHFATRSYVWMNAGWSPVIHVIPVRPVFHYPVYVPVRGPYFYNSYWSYAWSFNFSSYVYGY